MPVGPYYTPVPGKAPVFDKTTIPLSLAMYPFIKFYGRILALA